MDSIGTSTIAATLSSTIAANIPAPGLGAGGDVAPMPAADSFEPTLAGGNAPGGVDTGKAADAILKDHSKGRCGELLWAFGAGAKINSAPAVDQAGNLYFGSLDKKIYALDGVSGKKLWEVDAGEAIVLSSPALSNKGTLFIGTMGGRVLALEMSTGRQKWEFQTGGDILTSPALGPDGTLFMGSSDGTLYALNEDSGKTRWTFDTTGGDAKRSWRNIVTSPAVGADGTVYVGGARGYVHALDGATGQVRWETEVTYSFSDAAAPALGPDGTVYVGCNDYKLYALDGATGAKKWEFTAHGFPNERPAVGNDGTVYLGGDLSILYAVDGKTGKGKWEAPLEGRGSSSPVIHDGTVYIHVGRGCTENTIYAFDEQSGTEKWHYKPGGPWRGVGSRPSIGKNGEVFVGNDDGYMYALRGSTAIVEDKKSEDPQGGPGGIEKEPDYIIIDGVKLPVKKYEKCRLIVRDPRLPAEEFLLASVPPRYTRAGNPG